MCDYSLHHVASRPAVVADRLITTNFSYTSTRGFASMNDLDTAVCLRPGTEIAFDEAPRYDHKIVPWRCTAPSNVARFRQINLQFATVHHDALEFSDGEIVPLTRLVPGQRATVLQLPSESQSIARETETTAPETAEILA
jgi:hypothetical protein